MFKRWIVGISFFVVSVVASERMQLEMADVRNSMEEMFSYHVETKEITSLLVKRAFKIYLEQFDPQKIYLTQSEAKPFLELTSTQIEKIIDHYFADEYPEFTTLNKTIVKSIERQKKWREEFYSDFMRQGESLQDESSDNLAHYVQNPDGLRKRIRTQLLRLFKNENRSNSADFWTLDKRQKVCELYEKRFEHFEKSYLPSMRNDHYFAMHILKAMAKGLDAHTDFFTPEEALEIRSSLEKQFEGIGVVLREGLDGIEIVDLIKGGPAARSGQIQAGDFLTEIDGRSLVSASYHDALELLKGNGNKHVTLGLKRKDALVQVELKREKVLLEDERLTVSSEPYADGIIGKLNLSSFYETPGSTSCEIDLREALRNLKKKGKVLGVVLDLRNNLGGFLNQAVKVASLFITSGVVVISKYAHGEIQYLRNIDPRIYYNGPLVILTSKMSASAAEIVAQALQDYGVALVVGDERTYGKGTIQYQTITDTAANWFFKVTVGRYYTVSGRSTQIEGVKADILIPTSYAPYHIGERYLDYALKNDQIAPAFSDPLTDIPDQNRLWFQRNYLPYLQKQESLWVKMVPRLKQNSNYRIDNDPNFQLFLKLVNDKNSVADVGEDDLQMAEAVNIVKDMIQMK